MYWMLILFIFKKYSKLKKTKLSFNSEMLLNYNLFQVYAIVC